MENLLSESDSRARFVFALDSCLMMESSLVFRFSFFFCRHELTSWYFPLQCEHGPGVELEDSEVFFFFPLALFLLILTESGFESKLLFLTTWAVEEVAAV